MCLFLIDAIWGKRGKFADEDKDKDVRYKIVSLDDLARDNHVKKLMIKNSPIWEDALVQKLVEHLDKMPKDLQTDDKKAVMDGLFDKLDLGELDALIEVSSGQNAKVKLEKISESLCKVVLFDVKQRAEDFHTLQMLTEQIVELVFRQYFKGGNDGIGWGDFRKYITELIINKRGAAAKAAPRRGWFLWMVPLQSLY